MADQDNNLSGDILKLLTEDIQSHREHVQKLYRNAVWIGGVVIAGGISLVVFALGEQIDARILEYRIDVALEERVKKLTQTHLEDAKKTISEEAKIVEDIAVNKIDEVGQAAQTKAINTIDDYTSEKIIVEIEKNLASKFAQLTKAALPEIAKQILLPPGIVAAFDRKTGCPEGWTDVGKADSKRFAGRTIIAVGPRVDRKSNETTQKRSFDDKSGEEQHVLSVAELPEHRHVNNRRFAYLFKNGRAIDLGSLPKIDTPNGDPGTLGETRSVDANSSGFEGGDKPHNNMPPYIALYYCKKM